MSVFDSMVRPQSASTLKDPALWLLDALGGRQTVSGERVTPEKSLGLAPYYACLRAISEDIGKLPLIVYRSLSPRGKERQRNHPNYRLLHDEPNPEMSSISFRETMTHWALGWGGGVAEIERTERGVPAALWPIHPSRIEIKRDSMRNIIYIIRSDDITRERPSPTVLQQRDVLHIHGLGTNGLHGYSIAHLASESIGLGMAAQTFGSAFFGHGATMGLVLEHPGKLEGDAAKNLRRSWAEMHEGSANAYKTVILEEGMKATQTSIPPEQAQFLQTRYFQVEDIARWFRIPPHKIQHLLRSTFSNIEMQALEYVGDTLMPWMIRWEQEIKRKLFRPDETDLFVEHLVTALLRGDQKARSEFYTKQFSVGAMSPNDIRELENMNPIGPAGDEYFVPMNLAPIDRVIAGQTGKQATSGIGRAAAETACLRMFTDAAERIINKETKAIGRASAKYESADAFKDWVTRFCAEQEAQIVAIFGPVAESLTEIVVGTLTGSLQRRLYDALGRTAKAHVNDCRHIALRPGQRDTLEADLNEYRSANESTLADTMMKAVMQIAAPTQESDHAAS